MRYGSRKFILTVWAMTLLTVAMWIDKITGNEWLGGLGVALGMYHSAQVCDDHLNGQFNGKKDL